MRSKRNFWCSCEAQQHANEEPGEKQLRCPEMRPALTRMVSVRHLWNVDNMPHNGPCIMVLCVCLHGRHIRPQHLYVASWKIHINAKCLGLQFHGCSWAGCLERSSSSSSTIASFSLNLGQNTVAPPSCPSRSQMSSKYLVVLWRSTHMSSSLRPLRQMRQGCTNHCWCAGACACAWCLLRFTGMPQGSPGLRSLTQNHPPMLSTPSTANMVPQPPMLNMLSTLPTLPMLRMLPTDPMLQCEPTEPIEAVLPMLPKLVVGHL